MIAFEAEIEAEIETEAPDLYDCPVCGADHDFGGGAGLCEDCWNEEQAEVRNDDHKEAR